MTNTSALPLVADDVPANQSLLRRALRSPATRTGLIMMGLIVLIAFIGPLLAPYSPSEILGRPFTAPSSTSLLGTDSLGRDVLSRFLWGGRSLITMTILAAVIGIALGTAVGVSAAYFGRRTDMVLMRLSDVLLAFPTIVLALLLISMLGPNEVLLVIIVAISHVAGTARVMRGAALSVVDREYVLWSRTIGLPSWRIIGGQILPSITSPLMVEFGLRLMWSVGALASLSFLGYGIQPPASDWGLMVNENRNGLSVQVLTVIAPITAIAIFTIGGNLFAEGIARVVARTEGKSSR
ncbi:ABC transporter permease [Microbacterium saperdae]